MKQLLTWFYAFVVMFTYSALAQSPLTNKNVKLTFDYPPSLLSTDLTFIFYSTTNLSQPWYTVTNFIGTTNVYTISVVPGNHFFYVVASNFWGTSAFSNTTYTPPLPVVPANSAIYQAW